MTWNFTHRAKHYLWSYLRKFRIKGIYIATRNDSLLVSVYKELNAEFEKPIEVNTLGNASAIQALIMFSTGGLFCNKTKFLI